VLNLREDLGKHWGYLPVGIDERIKQINALTLPRSELKPRAFKPGDESDLRLQPPSNDILNQTGKGIQPV
jgi:hypothetical protein